MSNFSYVDPDGRELVGEDVTDEGGNRTITGPCGCHESSGGGAYGSRGSAWASYSCQAYAGQQEEPPCCWSRPPE